MRHKWISSRARCAWKRGLGVFLAFVTGTMAVEVQAEESTSETADKPTVVEVRVISQGGKFVGTSMGGAHVTIRDKMTGEILAQGRTAGATGDTEKIMSASPRQGDRMSTKEAAVFRAVLSLHEPRLIEVTAKGPMAQRQSLTEASQTQFVVPGKDITGGDAWLLELRGLVVDVLNPPAHIKLKGLPQEIDLRANVTMLCGCPISPETPWKSREFEVKALLKKDGRLIKTVDLEYAGRSSQFARQLEIETPGTYEAIVYAYRPSDGNTGLDSATFIVSGADDD